LNVERRAGAAANTGVVGEAIGRYRWERSSIVPRGRQDNRGHGRNARDRRRDRRLAADEILYPEQAGSDEKGREPFVEGGS